MHYVYVLVSVRDNKFYIGRSDDLRQRKKAHDEGRVTSTKYRRPLKLIFYEAFGDKKDAVRRELYLKTSKGRSTLKMMLRDTLINVSKSIEK